LYDTVKLADLKTPQFGTRIWDVSPIGLQAKLFVTVATGVRGRRCNVTIKLADPLTPLVSRGIICYGNRIIANTALRGPQCGV